jgi:hypothetical protein
MLPLDAQIPLGMTGFEKVYTVTDYYDDPRGGIADFCGKPHLYRSLFEDIDHKDTFAPQGDDGRRQPDSCTIGAVEAP